jgi:hypothetical protein
MRRAAECNANHSGGANLKLLDHGVDLVRRHPVGLKRAKKGGGSNTEQSATITGREKMGGVGWRGCAYRRTKHTHQLIPPYKPGF